ncbi:MAG: sugar ABC transporter permease [Christensenellaceae bacterium]|nr:sugar ABC transporter permease [Christensenellaceae bacterium]
MTNKKSLKYLFNLEFGKTKRQLIMMVVLVLICLGFSALTGGTFTAPRNLSNLCLQASATGVAAIGIVWILVAGHIDLSIGSFVGFMGALAGMLMVNKGWGAVETMAVVLVSGAILGAWQGYWIAYRRIPAFIVTLAGMQMFRGGCLMATGGVTLSPMGDIYKAVGQGYLPGIFATEKGFVDTAIIVAAILCVVLVFSELSSIRSRKKYNLEVAPMWFIIIKMAITCVIVMFVGYFLSKHMGLPIAVIVMGVLAVLFSFISSNTRFGRYVYAIGGNKEAAMLSGVNIKKTTFLIYVVMGLMCSISSIIYTARLNAATAAAGTGMEMDAIASAIIGGTSTMGGEGSVFGAIIGAFIMSSIDNGMSIMNLPPQVQYIVKGLVLLLAVWLDVSTKKNRNK